MLAAHPRSRGENGSLITIGVSEWGSSPLTRGKPLQHVNVHAFIGLIPAHAGKTYATRRDLSRPSAHPRSRGENSTQRTDEETEDGSSPLTRGKQGFKCLSTPPGRLIPAHAGKTSVRICLHSMMSAHPRSRGENELIGKSYQFSQGSSPLTRGKPLEGLTGLLSGRLIPAHAGKTPRAVTRLRAVSAHPRSRGENVLPRLPSADLAGSSPLTRGKQIGPRVGVVAARLIPAHAGKTPRQWPGSGGVPAHPRSRGENCSCGPSPRGRAGSSPLTRGKPTLPHSVPQRPRLIPAHAGKTRT